jgi:hypothetical protein
MREASHRRANKTRSYASVTRAPMAAHTNWSPAEYLHKADSARPKPRATSPTDLTFSAKNQRKTSGAGENIRAAEMENNRRLQHGSEQPHCHHQPITFTALASTVRKFSDGCQLRFQLVFVLLMNATDTICFTGHRQTETQLGATGPRNYLADAGADGSVV